MAVAPTGVIFDVRKWVVLSQGGRGCAESGVSSGGRKLSQSQGDDSEGEEEGTKGIGGVGGWGGGLSLEQGQTFSPVTSNLTVVTTFFPSEL